MLRRLEIERMMLTAGAKKKTWNIRITLAVLLRLLLQAVLLDPGAVAVVVEITLSIKTNQNRSLN